MATTITLPNFGQANWHLPLNAALTALAEAGINFRGNAVDNMPLAIGDAVRIPATGQVLVAKVAHTLDLDAVNLSNFNLLVSDGAAGTAATITSATATALAAGASPTVTLGGTASARTFAFGIPIPLNGTNGTSAGMTFVRIGPNDPLPAPTGVPVVIFRDS